MPHRSVSARRSGRRGRRACPGGIPARLALCAAFSLAPLAGGVAQDLTFSGQVRPRFEYRRPVANGLDDSFIVMRSRLGVLAELDPWVSLFVQVQDVRVFGEEGDPLEDFRADNFDVHQAYVEVRRLGEPGLWVRVGRQELPFGGERLMSSNDWFQQGQAFDGVRVAAESRAGRTDVFFAMLSDGGTPTHRFDSFLVGAYADITAPGALHLYGFFEHDDESPNTNRVTVGTRWALEEGPFRFRVEGAFQGGTLMGEDVRAFFIGVRAGGEAQGGVGSLTGWYDFLSGDDDPTDGTTRVFDPLFGDQHKFYGLIDFFTDIPRDTGNRGLHDVALKGAVTPHPQFTMGIEAHAFFLARSSGISTAHLGDELDFTATYRWRESLNLSGGVAHLFTDTAVSEIGRSPRDGTWGYLQLDVSF